MFRIFTFDIFKLVARLHANENFMVQLGKAKQEFAKLVKEGKVKKSETQVN